MTTGRSGRMIDPEVPMELCEDERVYTAGDVAPPGRYRRVDRPDGPTLSLKRPGVLPDSPDGRVALYQRRPNRLVRRPARLGPHPPRAVAALD